MGNLVTDGAQHCLFSCGCIISNRMKHTWEVPRRFDLARNNPSHTLTPTSLAHVLCPHACSQNHVCLWKLLGLVWWHTWRKQSQTGRGSRWWPPDGQKLDQPRSWHFTETRHGFNGLTTNNGDPAKEIQELRITIPYRPKMQSQKTRCAKMFWKIVFHFFLILWFSWFSCVYLVAWKPPDITINLMV